MVRMDSNTQRTGTLNQFGLEKAARLWTRQGCQRTSGITLFSLQPDYGVCGLTPARRDLVTCMTHSSCKVRRGQVVPRPAPHKASLCLRICMRWDEDLLVSFQQDSILAMALKWGGAQNSCTVCIKALHICSRRHSVRGATQPSGVWVNGRNCDLKTLEWTQIPVPALPAQLGRMDVVGKEPAYSPSGVVAWWVERVRCGPVMPCTSLQQYPLFKLLLRIRHCATGAGNMMVTKRLLLHRT